MCGSSFSSGFPVPLETLARTPALRKLSELVIHSSQYSVFPLSFASPLLDLTAAAAAAKEGAQKLGSDAEM